MRKIEIKLGIVSSPNSTVRPIKDFEVTTGKLTEKASEYPELFRHAWLDMHLYGLEYFLEKSKKTDASLEKLAQIAELVLMGYKTTDPELPFNNPFLEIEGKIEVPLYHGSESRTKYSKKIFKNIGYRQN